ncbi:cell envelope-related function transcriptional attenuator common domain [Clostridium sp. CAG:149]|nr:cell envelope-related function transcriptional attenuator common domain [Clostridium sp. CAG:149]
MASQIPIMGPIREKVREEDRELKPIRPRARAGRAAVILELLSIPEAGQRNHRASYQDPEPARTQAQVLLQAREPA